MLIKHVLLLFDENHQKKAQERPSLCELGLSFYISAICVQKY